MIKSSRVSIIAAHDLDNVIGYKGEIPWHLPHDLAKFKELTLGNAIIMGRKTFDSLKRPLAGRYNIVITSSPEEVERRYSHNGWFKPDKIVVVNSFEKALKAAKLKGYDHTFIIGGGEVYRAGLEVANDMYLTIIEAHYEGDARFPEYNTKKWEVKHIVQVNEDENDETPGYAFYFLERRRGLIEKCWGFLKGAIQRS